MLLNSNNHIRSSQKSTGADSFIADTVHQFDLTASTHSWTNRRRASGTGVDSLQRSHGHKKQAGRLHGSTTKQTGKQRRQAAGQSPSLRLLAASDLQDGGNTLDTATDLGVLGNYYSLQGAVDATDPVDYYRFNLASPDTLSAFFSGLSAGYSLDLLDGTGNVLKSSTNSGTTWDAANSNRTGGSVTSVLTAGTYYVRVTPATITGNAGYAQPGTYKLNVQPHNAPNTVTVAAQDSELANTADYRTTGSSDQTVINRAIATLGQQGGGTIVLMEGTYKLSNSILVQYDNITLSGVGWSTVLQLSPNANLSEAGLLRSAYKSESDNLRKPRFANQHFRHMSLDGNKDQGTDYTDSYGNYGTYSDSSFTDLRIHDFPHYGFDPHENNYSGTPTVRLTIQDSLSDHNAVDGLTTDDCLDSTFRNNILDSNGRHGINIVTASRNNLFENNVSTNNRASGITMQPGAIDLTRTSESNIIRNNIVTGNTKTGIELYRGRNSEVTGNTVSLNGYYGIRLRGTSYTTVDYNTVDNNSQSLDDKYSGIYLDNDGTAYATNNRVRNNTIRSTTAKRHRYGIGEKSTSDDYNTYLNNIISGSARKAIDKRGPNSTIA